MPDKNIGNNIGGSAKQIALALELPFLIVGPVVLGGAIGYFLDRWLHTSPALMLILGILGVVLGIRDAVKTASAEDRGNGGQGKGGESS